MAVVSVGDNIVPYFWFNTYIYIGSGSTLQEDSTSLEIPDVAV